MRLTQRVIQLGLAAMLLSLGFSADAQQVKKIPQVGFLSPFSSSSDSTRKEAFLQGLRDLGYVEGKNVAIEYRSTEGEIDRLPEVVAELLRLNVDVIITGSINAVRAAKKATLTIPIVFAAVGDAVDSGLVVSLAKPTGNATGLTFFAPELDAKRMALLKESFPKASLAAFLWLSGSARGDLIKAYEPIAKTLALRLYSFEVKSPADLESGFKAAKSVGVDVLIVTSNPLTVTHRARIVDLATQHRLPGIYPWADFAEVGGLMSYGPDIFDNFRRAAWYVDKILKGAKPADLPVEQPTKFELVINLNTARQIGLTIPPQVLARADKVIK